jgi:hypothetical protein
MNDSRRIGSHYTTASARKENGIQSLTFIGCSTKMELASYGVWQAQDLF